MSDRQLEREGLRLLSLDGGGIRGLSELLILREIMQRIRSQLKLEEEPLPCDYFDMIGGTSTGGLIALMLGRLGMSVEEAIMHYGTLAEEVFGDVKTFGGEGRFRARKLKEAIQKIVKEKTGKTEELLMNPEFGGRQCKTFVCAMSALDMRAGIPHLFRSYQAPKHQIANCTIWETARATSAAPTFFKQITIGTPGSAQPYIDGGLGRNNPAAQVLEEAQLMFPGRKIACIVSIGTGQAQTIEIPKPNQFQRLLPIDVVKALQGIATDCEATAQQVAQRFQGTPNVYFRFNVEHGMQHVGLAQWEKLPEVTAHTGQYIRLVEVDQKLAGAALAIPKAATPKLEPPTPPVQFRPIYRTGFDVDPRDCTATQIQQLYRDILPREPLIGYRSSVGNGALSLEFDGLDPVRWRSFLNADLIGPVRVETTVDLSRCNAIGTPSGAGVLVILPDKDHGDEIRDLFFIVEPSEVPQLHVLKLRRPVDEDNGFTSLHSEALPHCSRQQSVQVEVTVLDGMITVSTNGVASTWVLRMPTSGGPKRFRAFGLCGIGPRRITWTSFKISVGDGPFTPDDPVTESVDEDPELAMAIMMSMREEEARLEAEKRTPATSIVDGPPSMYPAIPQTITTTTAKLPSKKNTPAVETDEEAEEAALLAEAIQMSLRHN